MNAAAVSAAEFRPALDALLAPLGGQGAGRLALAVSGGSDSMALLRLAHEAYPGRIAALTVDHGLRAASGNEAVQVGDWCRSLGVPHQVLRWEGDKPSTGLQRRARDERYRLLAAAAARLGADGLAAPLIVAHTLDDQAETFLLRLAHGSDLGGLGAMRAASELASIPPVPLLRPLLAQSRAGLRATLNAYGQPWIDDPSNEDVRFERVRLRAILPTLESSGLSRQSLARAGRLMARIDRLLLNAALGSCPYEINSEGRAAFAAKAFAGLPAAAASRYLSHLIRVIGGEPYPPSRASLGALGTRMREAVTRGATLGGCRFRRIGGSWIVEREARAAARAEARLIADRGIALWDNRFWVRVPPGSGAVRVGAEAGLPKLLDGKKGPTPDLSLAADAEALSRMREYPAALFVGEARMQVELVALWRRVMKDTSPMEYDAATVS